MTQVAGPRGPESHPTPEALERFVADLSGESEATAVESHVEACAHCAAHVEANESALPFRQLRHLRATEAEGARLWQAVLAAVPREERPASRRLSPWSRRRGTQLAAAAAVLAATVLLMGRRPDAGESLPDSGRAAGPLASSGVTPCPATVAMLNLTADECAALFSRPFAETGRPVVVLAASLDLRGL